MSLTARLTKSITNYNSQNSIGSKLRAKRIAPFIDMMEAAYQENGSVNIIDIGGTESYWGILPSDILDKYNARITIVNLPSVTRPSDHGRYTFVAGDACNLSDFADGFFHIAHSNSVIEHVGDWNNMVSFAKEISRVASRYYVQTPYYWFPIEPHFMTPFFHWFPKSIRIWLILNFDLGNWKKVETVDEAVRAVDSARLLDTRKFRELFKDAHIFHEKLFGLPKSLIAIKN
ncbi:class I SAM-dependent methyltransferase [Desmonostoc muscorum LEGE 12446]|uniref:Class I SAM-dependent methyltransferase n=1 Tax=Desmonostoc muscorum LEGE 12446 TaxID=1828758 RepID=A0A8J7AGG6_DESMC|nr:class I SAM-dependent methyltransferase [Desmonostoc muscorum]MCF2146955.1 class I SAM-dependent methyltransferase [Desmonostoc muscorum LEGE 12446]